MSMDPLEKEHLRRRMAQKMGIFLESAPSVTCVSSHYYDEPHACELCGTVHAQELLVVKNRSGKKMLAGLSCLKEMIRFKVCDVEELPKWMEKLVALRQENDARKMEQARMREEERKRLEKKVIVRKRSPERL